jgi:hypothetical protein
MLLRQLSTCPESEKKETTFMHATHNNIRTKTMHEHTVEPCELEQRKKTSYWHKGQPIIIELENTARETKSHLHGV